MKVNEEKLREFWKGADAFDRAFVGMALRYIRGGTDDYADPMVIEAVKLLRELGILEEAASEEV